MPPIRDRIKEESKILKKEFRGKIIGFITGALGLVAGLAWNDAIKALIEYLFPLGKDGIPAKFVYAAVISLLVVLLTVFLVRWSEREVEK